MKAGTPSHAATDARLQPKRRWADLDRLAPANFGIVMATGIVSIALGLQGWPRAARGLLWLNLLIYLLLWALMVLRGLLYPAQFLGDTRSHQRGPGFFTAVAGSGVLGSQFFLLQHWTTLALVLWSVTLVLWLLCSYGVMAALTTKVHKPNLTGINGTWLLAVVGTQSLAVLGTQLGTQSPSHALPWHFLALVLWLAGGMLYIWIMTLIFYRYTFFRMRPTDLTPAYWINMGAMAISTFAGALLILNAQQSPLLQSMLPFIKGFTLFYWASGTWWIPMLLVLGVWLFGLQRQPLRYDPAYWGAVFPLGMYAACTFVLIQALALDFLAWLPPLFTAAAALAWSLAFAGLLHRCAIQVRRL